MASMPTTRDQSLYEQQADLCAIFSNPRRLMLLEQLKDGREHAVSDLQAATGIPQSTVSRHLRRMRDQGVVCKRNDGVHSYYTLTDDRIAEGITLMRNVLLDQLDREEQLVSPQ